MYNLDLTSDTNKFYPTIYIPDNIIHFIENGYGINQIAEKLEIEIPTEKDFVQIKEPIKKKLLNTTIKINDILNLKDFQENYNLEEYSYFLDGVELPKKPKFSNTSMSYIKVKRGFYYYCDYEMVFNSVAFLALIYFFIIYGLIPDNYSLFKTTLLTFSIITLLFLLLFSEFRLPSTTDEMIVNKNLKPLEERKRLLEIYKNTVSKIVAEHKNYIKKKSNECYELIEKQKKFNGN